MRKWLTALTASMFLLLLSIPLSVYAQTSETTFSWDYPVEEETNLGTDGGFRLHVGSSSGIYTGIVGTALPTDRERTFNTTMLCGDKVFAMTAFALDGTEVIESGYSNEVTQAYAPKSVTGLTYSDPGTFTWILNSYDTDCTVIGYDLYLSKTSGAYSAYDIVATTGKGMNNVSIDTSAYRGRWYATVIPYTTGSDGRKIVGDISSELSLTFRPNAPTMLRFTTPTS